METALFLSFYYVNFNCVQQDSFLCIINETTYAKICEKLRNVGTSKNKIRDYQPKGLKKNDSTIYI